MKIYYDKLWRLLKDNKMQKKDLASAAELSSYTMTKLNQNRPVSMDVILRLCKIFHNKALEAIAKETDYPSTANNKWREIYGSKFPYIQ